MQRDTIDFKNDNVGRLFRRLFLPTLVGSLSVSAMTAIDGIFVGHGIGSDGVAAVNLAVPFWMFFAGFGLMMGAGCSVAAAIHYSRKKLKVARLNVTQALVFASIVTLAICTLVMLLPGPTARLLGASPRLEPMVSLYLLGIMPGFLFNVWEVIGLFVIRLDGSPRTAMWCNTICALANILLDWIFVIVLDWGIFGAALASTISLIIGGGIAIVYLLFFARSLRLIPIKLSRKSLMLSLRNVGYHCRIGSSSILGEATLALLVFAGNLTFMHYLGDDGVGAFGIACYYLPFLFMVGNSIAQSAQPIISYDYGLRRFDRVRQTLRLLVLTSFLCGLIVTAAFTFLPQWLVGLFLSLDSPAARIAVDGFPLISTAFIPFILNVAVVGYLQSIERVRPATLFALLRGFVLLLPSFLLLPALLHVPGIWLALPAAETATMLVILAYAFYRRRLRKA